MQSKTFNIISLGCKVNSYECGAVSAIFFENGWLENEIDPEVYIINTCSVTSTADQKSRQHIRAFKEKHPDCIVVVMGCYAQKAHKFIIDSLGADIVTGTSHKNQIYDFVMQFKKDHIKHDYADSDVFKFDYEEICQTAYCENVRAYLKIQDGCSNFCTYCLIPYLRGKMRSRDFSQIIKEAHEIVSKGYQEIVLTGIHVGGYGKDLKDHSFYDVVNELTKIDGLKRITISSIEESEIGDDLISLYKSAPNMAHHIHIPLQSGSKAVLEMMNRHYNKTGFLTTIKKLKQACPDIAITTDVIVGFPGETDEMFEETVNFIKEVGFAQLHVFPYSLREGTVAAKLPNQIDPKIKKARAKVLRDLSNELFNDFSNQFKGQTLDVLVESCDEEKNICYGHTSNYINISFKGDKELINKIIPVKFE